MAERNNGQGQSGPLISVVIPVYNVEKYLRVCLDSVVSQTYRHFEVLLIDDGSTDGSGGICDLYQARDARFRVIHQENRGIGRARNTGLRLAGGKYVIFLDSDDYWRKDALAELLRESEKNDLQVLVFSAEPFCDGLQEPYRGLSYRQTCQNGVVRSGAESMQCAVRHEEYYCAPGLRLYRMDYLKRLNLWFDEEIIHEDESFSFLAYLQAERVECLGEKFYMRRYHPGSIMTSLDPVRSAIGNRTAAETIMRFMKEKPLQETERRLCCWKAFSLILAVYGCYKEADGERRKIIMKETQRTVARAGRELDALPFRSRPYLFGFRIGYIYWRMRN